MSDTKGHDRSESTGDAAGRSDERRYHSLVAATSDFVWQSRPDGALEQISGAWLELVGLDASEAAEYGWLDAVHPDDRRDYERTWREAVAQGAVHEQEYRLLCHDGRTRWFIDRAVPVRDDSGAIVEWIGAGHDITARREAEEELRRQREQYRTLVESTSAILWEGNPQTLAFTFVSSEAESLLGYPAERWTREPGFWIDHIHPDDREWVPAYCQRATEELRQHTFDYRMLAADGRVVWLRDVVSVLTDDDDRPVKSVGVMVNITNTKQTEQQLAYVSGLQRILVEAAEGLVAAGPDEVDAAINEALRQIGEYCEVDRSYMFRFDDDERMTMTHKWHAPDVEPLIDELVARPTTAVPSLVATMQRREVLHIPRVCDLGRGWEADREAFAEQGLRSIVIVPIVIGDRVHGYLGFDSVQRETEWRDEEIALLRGLADTIGATVQRDRAERQRQQSETRFRALAEHLPGVVYERVMHLDGTIELTYLSHNVAGLFGLDPEQAIADPRAIMESIHPDDRGAYTDALHRSAAAMSPLDFAHRVIAPDGSTRWARLLGEARSNEDGSITWHGITIDETERVEAEQRLRESRALQEIAGRTARVGGWVMDLERQELQWSDEVYAIHEVAPGTPLTVESALAFYTPEYRDRIREVYFACAEQGIPYDEEAEIRTVGGQRLWVRMIGEAVLDDSGRIVQV
ncbi:MAG: PAS domain-containing protein, partial [Halofilum sp. (in: g-proteobacteria)]